MADTNDVLISPGRNRLVWVLAAAVLILSQYVITRWVLDFGGDTNVVSYVGFAGTIVSIILAVLAIVYSYFQNFSQQRDAHALATQISLLRAVVEEVQNSEADLSRKLEHLDTISEKLDANMDLGRATQVAFEALHSDLNTMKAMVAEARDKSVAVQTETAAPAERLNPALRRRVAGVAAPLQLAVYVVLGKAAGKGMPYKEAFKQSLLPKLEEQGSTPTWIEYIEGYFTGTTYFASDVRLIRFDDQMTITEIDQEFLALVHAEATNLPEKSTILFKQLVEAALMYNP